MYILNLWKKIKIHPNSLVGFENQMTPMNNKLIYKYLFKIFEIADSIFISYKNFHCLQLPYGIKKSEVKLCCEDRQQEGDTAGTVCKRWPGVHARVFVLHKLQEVWGLL